MKKVIQLILVAILLNSCEYNHDIGENTGLTPGIYKGHFIRSSPTAKYAASNVTLMFTADKFSGVSDIVKYPAICIGTYKISGQEIEFFNDCPWTAEFDWSLVLSGKYEFNVAGDLLEIIRHSNSHTDRYELQLQ